MVGEAKSLPLNNVIRGLLILIVFFTASVIVAIGTNEHNKLDLQQATSETLFRIAITLFAFTIASFLSIWIVFKNKEIKRLYLFFLDIGAVLLVLSIVAIIFLSAKYIGIAVFIVSILSAFIIILLLESK